MTRRAFALIELMMVISIIAILAAMIIPAYLEAGRTQGVIYRITLPSGQVIEAKSIYKDNARVRYTLSDGTKGWVYGNFTIQEIRKVEAQ